MDVNHIGMEDGFESDITDPAVSVPLSLLLTKLESMEQRLNALSSRPSSSSSSSNNNKDRVQGIKPGDIRKLQSQNRCFRCKETGHMKNECTNAWKPNF